MARSRDPGLHGRKPVFRSPRALAESYCDAYIDFTGRLTGYAVVDLGGMGGYDWRFARRNVWGVEKLLLNGIEVHQAVRPFAANGGEYRVGSWVVLMDQPFAPLVKELFEPQR